MKTNTQGKSIIWLAFVFLFGAGLGQAQPMNDMFSNSRLLVGTNIVVTNSTVGATHEAGEPYHAGDGGGGSVWFVWTAPAGGSATISTYGSNFDTLLGVYTGSSVSALTEVASNDDENFDAGLYTSKVVFAVEANQTYLIAVDGYDGEQGTARLSLQLGPFLQAPAWQLPDPNGVLVNSSSYAGKVVLLNYWATWCVPCLAEMPDIVALQDKYRADGLVVVGADTGWSGDTPAVVRNFLAAWTPAINYQVVMANVSMMNAYGGIDAIPTTFIIDRQNRIRRTFVGTQTQSSFEQAIIPLLYGNTRLNYQPIAGQLIVSWPTNAVNFTLESTTNLASPSWSAWPAAPVVTNGSNTVQVILSGPPRYFRLKMTN